jgi:hypothetical protein
MKNAEWHETTKHERFSTLDLPPHLCDFRPELNYIFLPTFSFPNHLVVRFFTTKAVVPNSNSLLRLIEQCYTSRDIIQRNSRELRFSQFKLCMSGKHGVAALNYFFIKRLAKQLY